MNISLIDEKGLHRMRRSCRCDFFGVSLTTKLSHPMAGLHLLNAFTTLNCLSYPILIIFMLTNRQRQLSRLNNHMCIIMSCAVVHFIHLFKYFKFSVSTLLNIKHVRTTVAPVLSAGCHKLHNYHALTIELNKQNYEFYQMKSMGPTIQKMYLN